LRANFKAKTLQFKDESKAIQEATLPISRGFGVGVEFYKSINFNTCAQVCGPG
jgi:hypothetical protein